MATKKKRRTSVPRCKRMKRRARLQSARRWLTTYQGKSFVKGYKKHFGVDEVCALLELRALGHQINDQRIEAARKSAQKRAEINAERRRSRTPIVDPYPDSDEHHYFVAGYTSNGFAFGITWGEAEAQGLDQSETSV